MEPLFTLATTFAKDSLHDVAYSALPNSPVQPVTEPRRRHRWALARIRRPARQPVIGMRTVCADC